MRRSIKMLGRIFGEAFGQPGRAVARRSRQDRARSGRSTRHWLEALEPRLLLESGPWQEAFVLQQPAGCLIYRSTCTSAFAAVGETDRFTFGLDAGQTLSLRLTPQAGLLLARAELFAPGGVSLGAAAAGGAGQTLLIENLPVTSSGTYELQLNAVSGTGGYQVELTLNAAVEAEVYAGATNNTTATAQALDASSVALQDGASRLGVVGRADGDADVFSFMLSAGERAALALHVDGGDAPYPRAEYAVGNRPFGLASADLDGDGKADLAVATEDEGGPDSAGIAILRGHGDGTFGAASVLGAGVSIRDVALGDLNGDTYADIVAVSHQADENQSIYVWLNNGSGGFGAPLVLAAGGTPVAVALGRMNAGASLDIVIAADGPYGGGGEGGEPGWTHAGVGVLLGDGAGGFGAVQWFNITSGTPADVVLGDVNNDTRLDVLTANGNANGRYGSDTSISVLLGQGDGTLGPEQRVEVGAEPLSLALGLLDGDTVLDVVTANGGGSPGNTLSVLRGLDNGTYATATQLVVSAGSPAAVAVADFDGDGRRDILSANGYWGPAGAANSISVFRGAGDGTFALWNDLAAGTDPAGLVVADLDGAGMRDIVAINAGWENGVPVSSVSVLLGLPQVSLQVLNPAGTVAAQGIDSENAVVDECITGFTAAQTGTYYARVSGGRGQDYTLVVTRQADFELPADLRAGEVQAIGPSHQVLGRLDTSAQDDAFAVVTEGFEGGTLPAGWTAYTSDGTGRVRVTTDDGAAGGTHALVLDRGAFAFGYALEEAIWTVNLSDNPSAILSFRHADLEYSEAAFAGSFTGHANADGIAISADGITWHPVWNAPDQASGQWLAYSIDLAAEAAAAGITLGSGLRIKFQQYGLSIYSPQGRGWDNIALLTRGDRYAVEVKSGDNLALTLQRPGAGAGAPANDLSAQLRLNDETGTQVAADDDLDGVLAWTAASTGAYVVVLHRLSGAGDYTLRIQGATGEVQEDFHVASSLPADGALIAHFPSVYRVDLSLPVQPGSVDAGDLRINGAPATGVRLIDADTLEFDVATLHGSDGVYTATIAAGALETPAGTPIQGFSANFDYDTAPPTVTAVAPLSAGGTVAPGDLALTITFSEPLNAGVLDAADMELVRGAGNILYATDFAYDAATQTLTLNYASLAEGAYALTLRSSTLAFCDAHGNPLDGNGDGTGGDAFVLHFNVDAPDRALPGPLQVVLPFGANMYGLPSWINAYGAANWQPGQVSGGLHDAGDIDRFTIGLDAGQSLSLALYPNDPAAAAQIQVLGPGGEALGLASGAAGATVLLQSVPALAAGTYTVAISSPTGAIDYNLQLLLNGQFERESYGGPSNGTPAGAQALLAAGDQGAVVGWVEDAAGGDAADTADYYALNLQAGEALHVAAVCALGSQHVDVALLDAAGTVVALGIEGAATNVDEFIAGYVAPTTGTYHLRLTSDTGAGYALAASRSRALEVEGNDSAATAQRLDAGAGARGFLDDPRYDVEPNAFGAGAVLTTVVPGVTLSVEGQAGTVMALSSVYASTSPLVFAYGPLATSNEYWRSMYQWLRIDFDQPVDAVAIDAIATYAWTNTSWAWLEAYDAADNLLATVQTPGGAGGGTVYTLQVVRPRADIDHVRVSGRGGNRTTLDNLVVGLDKADYYTLQPAAGQQVQLATATPGGAANEPENTLDPRIDLYDANGNLVGSNDNGAFDGRNARLSFLADGQTYTVKVSGVGRGVYDLTWTGAALTNAAPSVIDATPAERQVLAHAPAKIDIVFSENVRSDLLNATALVVDGVGPATSAEMLDGRTVRYTVGLDAADVEGLYSYTLAPGACLDLQGLSSLAYTGSFFVDRTGPAVVTTSPLPAFNEPFSDISVEFSEPIDPASVREADVVRFIAPDGGNVNVSRVEVNGRMLTIVFAPSARQAGTYTFEIGPDIRDLVGNPMDQDGNGTYGEPSDTYTGTVDLILPDLVIESVTVAPAPAQFGQTVDVTWLARNVGLGSTLSDWALSFWFSQDDTLDTGTDQFLLGQVAGAPVPLLPDQTHGATTTVTIPFDPGAASGTYYILVKADPANSILEVDEANNVGVGEFELVQTGMPDLTIAATVDAASAPLGSALGAHWTVTNAGTAAAEGAWYDFVFLSANQTYEPALDRWITTRSAAAHVPLAAGDDYDVATALSLPTDVAPGDYFLLFRTDHNGNQSEQSEDNNQAVVPIHLTAPDLWAEWLNMPATAQFGQTLHLTLRVHNQGDSAVLVAWRDYFVLNQIGVANLVDLGGADTTATIPLAPGAYHDQLVTLTLPLDSDLSPGAYRLTARVDAGNDVHESNEQNNAAAADLDLTLPPLPNLAVTEVVAPADAWSGTRIPVEWEVSNLGTAAASGTWLDRIFLADNPQGLNGMAYADVPYTGTLEPGQSLARKTVISLPNDLQGTWYVVVHTDQWNAIFEHANEADNVAAAEPPMAVHLTAFPNLTVGAVETPAAAFAGQRILVEWTVTNAGLGTTSAPVWTDKVYLSKDLVLGDDIELGSVTNASYLAPGESYRGSLNVTLPRDVEGPWYLLVETDAGGQVVELDHEHDNVGASGAMDVTIPPYADLRVIAVDAPPTAFSGQAVTIRYTVKNAGQGQTDASSWPDQIHLSRDTALDPDDALLKTITHQGVLASDGSYNVTATVDLDVDTTAGSYYFIVTTDAAGGRTANTSAVFEYVMEGNNDGFDPEPTEIFPAPDPDLEALSVDMPASGLAGHEVLLSWQYGNFGPAATPNGGRFDAFYLSTDPVRGGDDILLRELGSTYPPIQSGEITGTTGQGFPLRLPYGIEGDYYVLFQVDSRDQVREIDDTNNIVASSHTIHIESRPPDLVAAWKVVPSAGVAGQGIYVEWTVTNQGVGDSAVDTWTDVVFVDGVDLASIPHKQIGGVPLGAGQSYTQGAVITLPPTMEGVHYISVVTDGGERAAEYRDVFEGGNEGNNETPRVPIIVTRHPADLQPTDFQVTPGIVASGQELTLDWTVENLGNGPTVAGAWYDRVYLSLDEQLDAEEDVLLGSVRRSGELEGGEGYSVHSTFTVPIDLSGDYHVILSIDDGENGGVVLESDETNNLRLLAAPVTVLLSPTPDLVVAEVDAPATAYSGLTVDIRWTVRNDGADAGGSWYDTLYLSRDLVLDRKLDAYLGIVEHKAGLNGTKSYQSTLTATVPVDYAGPLYVFVVTDVKDDIHERGAEDNNVGYDPYAMVTSLTPPAELQVTNIVTPAAGVAGQNADIRYTVRNNHPDHAAEGTWYDSVYLSADAEWDINDPLVALVEVTGPVAPGAQYQQVVSAPLPGVIPGDYYVIVRSDIRNLVRESDEHNNMRVSADTISVNAAQLQLDVSANGTLAEGQSVYYYVDVPVGETLYVTLDSQSVDASTELYLRYGQMASRSQHDFAFSAPFEPDQKIVVPFTQAGRYYVLAYGDSGGPADYTVQASLLDFTVLDEGYGQGGNAGSLTLQINGAKFDRTVTAYLTDGGAQQLWADSYYYVSQSRLYATFDLKRLNLGTFDLVVGNDAGAHADVRNALEVVSSAASDCTLTVAVAEYVFLNHQYPITFSWLNESLNDIQAPLITLHSELEFQTDGTVLFSPNPAGPHHRTHVTLVGAAAGDGPAGIIRPGQTQSMVVYATATPLFSTQWFKIGNVLPDAGELLDWDEIRAQLRQQVPFADISDGLFQTIFTQMQAQVGSTAGDYRDMLARNATLLGWEDTSPRWPETADALEFRKAWAAIGTSLSGRGMCDDIAVDISARTVTATDMATGKVYSTTSLTDGSFIFEDVLPGTYQLGFDGALVLSGGTVTVAQGQAINDAVLNLSAGATLTGTVSDAVTGLALANADIKVLFASEETFVVQSDAQGRYLLSALPEGTCTLSAWATGSVPVEVAGVALRDGQQTIRNFAMPVCALIRGTVQLPSNPPEGFQLYVSATQLGGPGWDVTVDGLSFSLANIPGGTYDLTLMRYGYVPLKLRNMTVTAGQTLDLGTLSMERAASVSGIIVPQVPGMELSYLNTMVAVFDGQTPVMAGMADSAGRFQIDTVPPGKYTARVLNLGQGLSTEQEVTLLPGGQATGIVLNILAGGVVTGTVTNTANGQPAQGVPVDLVSADGQETRTTTDAAGRYRFPSLPLGQYVASVTSYGLAGSEPVQVTAADGTEVVADLSYTPVATIGGLLRTDDGLLVRDGQVSLLENGRVIATTSADLSGAFQFALLRGGTFQIQATSDFVCFGASATVTVNPGDEAMVNLTAGDGTLAVSLASSSGPVGGRFSLRLTRLDTQAQITGTIEIEAGGAHTLRNLSAGDYQVEVWGNGLGGEATISVAGSGTTPLTVTLHSQHTLTGQVTQPGGGGLSGAWLSLISSIDGKVIDSGISDANGFYEMKQVDPGTYELVVTQDGYATAVLGPVVVAGSQVLDVALPASTTTLTGRLIGPDGVGVSGGVDVFDAAGQLIGQTATGPDGVFHLTTAWGDGLTLRASVPGCGMVEVSNVALPAGGNLDVGKINVVPAAVAQKYTDHALHLNTVGGDGPAPTLKSQEMTPADAPNENNQGTNSPPVFPWSPPSAPANEEGAPPNDNTGNNPPLFPLDRPQEWVDYFNTPQNKPPDLAEYYPSYFDEIKASLGDQKKSPDHVELGDFSLRPECLNSCGSLYARLVNQVRAQDLWWEAVEAKDDVVDEYVNVATGLFASEVALAASYLGTAVATCYGVAAALGSTAAAASLVARESLVIANAVYGVANALWNAGVWLYDSVVAVMDPKGSAGQLTNADEAVFNQVPNIEYATDAVRDAITAIRKVKSTPSYGCGIFIGAWSLLSGLQGFIDSITLKNTISTLNDLDDQWMEWKNDIARYKASASKARQLLDEFNAAQQNCDNDDNQNNEDAKKPSKPTVPADPNDIVGPTGVGSERWVSTAQTMDYMIRFENDPVFANAPAHVVRITQKLDSDLDYRTFRLGDFSIGALRIDVPDNVSYYQTRLDLTATRGVYLDVAAGIDMKTGQAFWLFTSLDPLTGAAPQDPMLGFLPPNQHSPEGQAYVTYTVKPKATAQTGSIVDAQARIVFDTNEPIDTPSVFNTLDAAPPTSGVLPLPAVTTSNTFTVNWAGEDSTGSSVGTYDIFVSDGGGPFTCWLTATAATSGVFVGANGHRYGFYSVARDNVGNTQATPPAAQAATAVTVPPRVTGVYVRGSAWTSAFLTGLAGAGFGDARWGYLIPVRTGAQLKPLSWSNIDQISVAFDEDVTVMQSNLALAGVTTAAYGVAGGTFSYDGSLHVATWTLSSPIAADQLLLALNADGASPIHDAAGNRLDGEWTNPSATGDTNTSVYPSGNGVSGGDFQFRFSVLPGDVNQDALVQAGDGLTVRAALGSGPGQAGYSIFADIDGNGLIQASDGLRVRAGLGNSLPSGTPAVLGFAAAMIVRQLPSLRTAIRIVPSASKELLSANSQVLPSGTPASTSELAAEPAASALQGASIVLAKAVLAVPEPAVGIAHLQVAAANADGRRLLKHSALLKPVSVKPAAKTGPFAQSGKVHNPPRVSCPVASKKCRKRRDPRAQIPGLETGK